MASKKRTYYGPFLWLSLAAFVAPVFVGVHAFQTARPFTAPDPAPDVSGVDHGLWDYLLKNYVSNGLVDYKGLERTHHFAEYLRQLGAARPDKLATDDERLALLCNAYNALVINGVITHGITDHVIPFDIDGVGFFDLEEHILAGETISLNELEHEMIRPVYDEPRIHMALVCAAKSCPEIRAEAYVGEQIERQLEDQAVQFANDISHVHYNKYTQTVHLSAILKWYGEDFGGKDGYLEFLAERAKDESLKAGLEDARRGEATIEFNAYDWTLNAQGKAMSSGRGGEFGSGSIPNR